MISPPGTSFLVEVERFQGPLDLLLHLIREQDIDIFDIPIAGITNQFLAAVRELEVRELDSAGEFLELAATLIRIKAQMLLPRSGEEEEEDPRAELVRRLLEYEQIREIVHRMERTEADRSRRFRKGYLPIRALPNPEDSPLETEWEELFGVAMALRMADPTERDHRVTPRTISMEEKSELILRTLREGGSGIEFRRLLAPFRERMHGVMTFLAGLELTKRRLVHLRQSGPFEELWVFLRKDEDGPVEEEEAA